MSSNHARKTTNHRSTNPGKGESDEPMSPCSTVDSGEESTRKRLLLPTRMLQPRSKVPSLKCGSCSGGWLWIANCGLEESYRDQTEVPGLQKKLDSFIGKAMEPNHRYHIHNGWQHQKE